MLAEDRRSRRSPKGRRISYSRAVDTTSHDPAAADVSGSPSIRFAVATDGPIESWQALAVEALAGVDRAFVARWDRRVPPKVPGSTIGTGARQVVDVPSALLAVRDAGPAEVDVVLDLTTATLPPPSGPAPEIWHFSYGPDGDRDPVRASLLDYIRTPGRSRVTLVSEPSGRVLRQGIMTSRREEKLDRLLIDPSGWPASVAVERIHAQPGIVATGTPGPDRPGAADPSGRGPSAVPMPILRIAGLGRRGLKMRDALTRHDDWNVGVIRAPIADVVAAGASQPIEWFARRPGRFAADPFGVSRGEVLHVFFEDYDQREGRGRIAYRAIGAEGAMSDVEMVLDPGVHASYPYLVEDDGAVFMLPETSAANELVLYEASDFPRGWRRAAVLLQGVPVVDASVVRSDDRWWMFGGRADRGSAHNLFIWHAPRLTGPWTPHPANPVKTDARSARPGGTPFVVDGALYRPSQDCSMTYGGRVTVSRIDRLTSTSFSETPTASIGPPPGSPQPDGFHTISAAGSITLVDGKTQHLVPGVLERTLHNRANRLARRLPGVVR